jgi:amino acid adenylation domain-containing protein/thioester reductase-like protein
MNTITDANKNFDDICLHDLFIEQAKKTPDAVALVDYNSSYRGGDSNADGTIELTYRQIDSITDNLAVKLIEDYGVGPDSVVGILLPRCTQYVLAYLAILKAGGAYMPLELVYPKPLLERAVRETNTKVVFTNDTYANRIDDPALVLKVTNEAPYYADDFAGERASYPPPAYVRPKSDHLAFCVMSSGTTGTPKGICQTHRAAVHSYMDRAVRFPFHTNPENGSVEDRAGAGVFFVWELMRPMLYGATTVVIPDHVLFDPDAVTKFVRDRNITRLLWTPSLLQLVLDSLSPDDVRERLAGLRYLWLCGEVVSRDLALGFSSLLPDVELMNLYSISECHDVSIGDLKRELLGGDNEDNDVRKYATCGKAIPGVKFYIVDLEDEESDKNDGEMKLVPDGGTGEVYVGGPVVGRGYLNQPEKTAERFVDNPFLDNDDGSAIYAPRLYRTGDLGRILPDSKELEILGRCDFMVKIRGYSVVLGAIETALAKHPRLSSAVVLAVGGEGSRDKKLVAYVVPVAWKDPPSASSVRQFLKEHVPPYAIPSTFCVIDALPVAASAAGKLDRKKLPPHETAQRLRAFSIDGGDISADFENGDDKKNTNTRLAPENDTEEGILEIWSQLLDLPADELSVLDSFFEIGGHSLLATKMVKMINDRFSGSLSIITFMEAPTIRDLSNFLTNVSSSVSTVKKVDMQAEALSLDPSIYPFPTRKGNTMSRFRIESSALLKPRVIFLTGATGYLGSHILSELLQIPGLTTICLARAKTDAAAKQRLLQTMEKYKLLKGTVEAIKLADKEDNASNPATIHNSDEKTDEAYDLGADDVLDSRLIAVAGDFSKPLLGIDDLKFKSLALEIDSIIHCGAEVNLIKPYSSLKESNVLGTQEILRLATTNGFIKTKVKPVHYISTNGIFPVDAEAYPEKSTEEKTIVHLKEDVDLDKFSPFLTEGYAMTKWVAERMCTVAESRGLPVSILRPGNMAGSSLTGLSNPDDLNYLLLQGILDSGCAPLVDTDYALDLTPVDFAAKAVSQLAAQSPHLVIGQRMHLQSPHKPVPLKEVVEWLNNERKTTAGAPAIESVTRAEWIERIATTNEKLSSGWLSFEKYFEAYTWLEMGSDNLQQALKGSSVECPNFDISLLKKWFPTSP